MEGCSKRLEAKLDAWREKYDEMCRFQDDEPPTMKAVVNLYWNGLDLISRMQDELEQLKGGIVPATARFSATPASHSGGHSNPTADQVFRIDILSGQVDEMEKLVHGLYLNINWFVTYEIGQQHDREIYYMRAIQRMPYLEISKEASYSDGYCRKVVSRYGKMTTYLQ
ncbi:MAG: hypothetical protein K2M42_09290 [Oscillospiraceae bacterium]|nr:hypothetical protein [Oscillospiraceae bacterium]